MGYHRCVPRRKFGLRPYNKPKRVAWCQQRLHWTYEDWKRVVWTNKLTFSTAGFGHRAWVTRKADEEYHQDCIDEVWESGQESRMVWGAFCGTTKSDLVFIPGKAKVNAVTYVETVMKPYLVPFWHKCYEEYG